MSTFNYQAEVPAINEALKQAAIDFRADQERKEFRRSLASGMLAMMPNCRRHAAGYWAMFSAAGS
jgi:hypothetical protein